MKNKPTPPGEESEAKHPSQEKDENVPDEYDIELFEINFRINDKKRDQLDDRKIMKAYNKALRDGTIHIKYTDE